MELLVDIEKELSGFYLRSTFKTEKGTLGLLGASGSGKSMILRCIAGIETPTKGRIVLNGRVLFDSEKKINLPSRKRKVGILFQNYALFPNMNVFENIAFALYNMNDKQKMQKVCEKIDMMQLNGLEERYPRELSGGQQQRVALARAMAIEPEALLLDEPFSALDNHLKSQVEKQLLENLLDYDGISIFVTHNMEEAYRICTNLQIVKEGSTIAYGSKEEIFDSPPNLTAARLTGCKNFSRIQVISPGVVKAVDWNCIIRINEPIKDSHRYIGLRANHIVVSDRKENIKGLDLKDDFAAIDSTKDNCEVNILENIFNCWVVESSETPFRRTVYLSLKRKLEDDKSYQLQWEVSKEKWEELKDKPQPWKIYMNEEKLFLVEE